MVCDVPRYENTDGWPFHKVRLQGDRRTNESGRVYKERVCHVLFNNEPWRIDSPRGLMRCPLDKEMSLSSPEAHVYSSDSNIAAMEVGGLDGNLILYPISLESGHELSDWYSIRCLELLNLGTCLQSRYRRLSWYEFLLRSIGFLIIVKGRKRRNILPSARQGDGGLIPGDSRKIWILQFRSRSTVSWKVNLQTGAVESVR